MNVYPEIIYEDSYLLSINKPSGMASQKDQTGQESIWEKAERLINAKLHLLNRLDRPVSGILLFSKNPRTTSHLLEQQKTQKLIKTYCGFVEKGPILQQDTLSQYLLVDKRNKKSKIFSLPIKNSMPVTLNYKLVAEFDKYYLLQFVIHSGKFHQIRAQISSVRAPLKGDVKYGARRKNSDRSIHLHARSLEFQHPAQGKTIVLKADFPDGDTLWKEASAIDGI